MPLLITEQKYDYYSKFSYFCVMIKALFFDIDGTLVSFQTHKVPQSTVDALVAAKERGVRVFISTGRPKVIINNLEALDNKNVIDGYVSMNGAYCFVDDKVIDRHCLPHSSVVTIANYIDRLNAPCIFVGEHDIRVYRPNKMVESIFYDYLHVDKMPVVTFAKAIEEDVFQMTPFISVEQEAEILSQVQGCTGDRWHPAFTDITASGCDKRHGVELVANYFGYTNQEVMCFGDGGNDISMFQYAAIGVAMGNANDEVKAAADFVTTTVDEDGVRNALQHFNVI